MQVNLAWTNTTNSNVTYTQSVHRKMGTDDWEAIALVITTDPQGNEFDFIATDNTLDSLNNSNDLTISYRIRCEGADGLGKDSNIIEIVIPGLLNDINDLTGTLV